MHPFIDGIIAGYGIAIPVGAVAVLIINTAIRGGFRTGFMAGAGAATADFLYALLASVAGVVLTAALKPVAIPLRIVGGLVLVGIALAGLRQGFRRRHLPVRGVLDNSPVTTYLQFLGITLLNPLTIVYFTAYIIGRDYSTDGFSIGASVLFVAGAGLSSLSWQTLLAVLGGVANQRLAPNWQNAISLFGNLLVLVLGLRILLSVIAR